MTEKSERIAKVIARSGLCSRREAERWIEAGRVNLNGQALESAACTVTDSDTILVDDKPLLPKVPTRLWLFHKPRGIVTTHDDPEGRPTLFELIKHKAKSQNWNLPDHLISIGRLDLMSEGLILLTNDGELSRILEHPSSEIQRMYEVRVQGHIPPEAYADMENGLLVEGVYYGPITYELGNQVGCQDYPEQWVRMILKEGKNREIRRVVDYLGGRVTRLIRQSYGPFKLGDLQESDLQEVKFSDFAPILQKKPPTS